MKGENYKTMSAYFSETKARNQTIKALHDVLPLVMYIFYPVQMIALAINNGIGSEVFLRFTLIPLCTLIFVTRTPRARASLQDIRYARSS